MTIEIRKIACARCKPKAQAPEDKEMKIRDREMVSDEPTPVRKRLVNVSEVIFQLCRLRLFHRRPAARVGAKAFCPPKSPKRRMHCARKIRHPAQSFISLRRPDCRQQGIARCDIRYIRENGRHFRDRAVGCGHQCRDTTERIDGKIVWVGLPAPFDAFGLIGRAMLDRIGYKKVSKSVFYHPIARILRFARRESGCDNIRRCVFFTT
jgi:hypothetical protein